MFGEHAPEPVLMGRLKDSQLAWSHIEW